MTQQLPTGLFVDFQWETEQDGVPWTVQVLSNGSIRVECGSEELSIPANVSNDLAEEVVDTHRR